MLQLLLCLQDYECSTYEFARKQLAEEDANVWVDISARGFKRYIDKNIDMGLTFLQTAVLPEIATEIAGFEFVFQELKIADAIMPNITFIFEHNACQARMADWSIVIEFQFKLIQQTYPYLTDSGSGKIILELDASIGLSEELPDWCPYHILLSAPYFQMDIQHLQISMNGSLAWLYESILQPLSRVMQDIFNDYMSEILAQAVVDVGNTALIGLETTSCHQAPGTPRPEECIGYVMDQRWINITVDEQFVHASSPSQMCYKKSFDEPCVGFVDEVVSPKPGKAFNADIQYYVSRVSFQSELEMYARDFYDPALLGQGLKIRLEKFSNTGAIINVVTNEVNTTFLASVQPTTIQTQPLANVTAFRLLLNTRLHCTGSRCSDEVLQKFMDEFHEKNERVIISYNNGNNVDTANCMQTYCNNDWFLAGCPVFE